MKNAEDLPEHNELPFNECLWIERRLEIEEKFIERFCSILFFLSVALSRALSLCLSSLLPPVIYRGKRDRHSAKKI